MPSRRALPPLALAMLLIAAVASAQTLPAPRLNAEQRRRAEALSKLVDSVFAQKVSAPADVAITWRPEFLASDRGLVYIPYTINIDGRFTGMPVALYVRVLTKDALPASYDASKSTTLGSYMGPMGTQPMGVDTTDIRSGNVAATGVVSEDIHFFEPPKDGRLLRGLWLRPGEYNVYVAMQERGDRNLPRAAVLAQPITVPDLSSSLAVSSVILASSLEPAVMTSKNQSQLDDPFAIAGTRIIPAPSTRLARAGDLTAVFFVYNPQPGPAGKPDLTAEYTFYRRASTGSVAFQKSPSQAFNERTLPPKFDLAAQQQIMGGMALPLSDFPAGEYQFEVKVTDNVTKTSVSRTVDFSVFGQ